MAKKYKKITKYSGAAVIFAILFFSSVKFNNWLEWQMTAEALGTISTQLGITNAIVSQCTPSCQAPVLATCCIGAGAMCSQFIPGLNGTYDTGCPMFSSVTGMMAGGMGNMALLSNVAIAQAGLSSGGQLIYGGTTNNMSMMAPSAPNAVLASGGGCYGCMSSVGFWNGVVEKFKFVIASLEK